MSTTKDLASESSDHRVAPQGAEPVDGAAAAGLSRQAAEAREHLARKHIEKVSLYGVSFSRMGMDETVEYVTHVIEAGKPFQVITANPIILMTGLDHPEYHRMLREADLIVPDGTGIVWAAKYVGQPVKERVAGFDLMHRLFLEGEERGWSAYLLGTTQDTIDEAASKLKQKYPGVRIAGTHHGFFGEQDDHAIIAAIREARPDMLFVARSVATQEPWIARYKDELGVPLQMGVGGSFDIIAGKLKRAPVLFQKLRLEWFYRLLQQPSRYRRMLVLPQFALRVIREKEKVTKPY